MTEIHRAAATGFEGAAARYGAGRPDYPAELEAWLTDRLGLGAGATVVDLGAGTGKFEPRLLATGATVIAVEPVAAMRAEFARRFPGIEVREGTAEAIPLADASVDVVVAAQAFHWFATAAAVAEIGRVLKPGGRLGLIWNVRDETVPWVARLTGIMTPYEGDAPRFHTGRWREPFPAPGFGPLEETWFTHRHTGPAERVVVDRILSVSFVAALPEAERETVAAAVRAVVAETPDLVGKAEVTFPYRTLACLVRRL
jgi:SAM-dependent methyltransferase